MNDFDSIVKRMTVTKLEPGDYTGADGLLYCGKCRTPKQFCMFLWSSLFSLPIIQIPYLVRRDGSTGNLPV
jgi:hypothetical protein